MKKTGEVIDVNEATFKQEVLAYSDTKPVLVDFWAEWCAPCLALTPTLERIAAEFSGRFRLAKVEVDDNMHLAGHYKLRGFPTVIVFVNQKPVERFAGNKAYHVVRDMMAAILE